MFKPAILASAMALLAAVSPASSALAANFNLNLSTGFDSSGNLITTDMGNDGRWTINAAPAKLVRPGDGDWWGFWAGNDSHSQWIARDPSTAANGVGVYSTTFDLTGVNISTVTMAGHWAVDDEGTLNLNGHPIGAYQPHDGWNTWPAQTFSLDNSSGWFNQGSNVLTLNIAVADAFGGFFEAVRLDAGLSGQTVPEPASLALLALGGAGLLLRRRVRAG